jgi:hypothetical protein
MIAVMSPRPAMRIVPHCDAHAFSVAPLFFYPRPVQPQRSASSDMRPIAGPHIRSGRPTVPQAAVVVHSRRIVISISIDGLVTGSELVTQAMKSIKRSGPNSGSS